MSKTKRSFAISTAIAVVGICALLTAQDPGSSGTSVLTWQYDHGRTGQNLTENTLTYTLSKSNFGQLCSVSLDGQVYAQPLVVTQGKINGTRYPNGVVYVVTQNDTLYAIDGTPPTGTGNTCAPVASLRFLTTGATSGHSPADCTLIGGGNCGAIAPTVGIVGTPVIVLANSKATMYLVTETQKFDTGTASGVAIQPARVSFL